MESKKRKLLSLIAVIICGFFCLSLQATESEPFARYPAVSPDGQLIAFSFQGDIWTVSAEGGRAFRLTIHEGYDGLPQWSPDGRMLAFVSNRYGNDDIFVVDAQGGTPRRLTFHSAADLLGDWGPEGNLLFASRRTYVQVERELGIYEVSSDGGTPVRVLDALGYTPAMSPDGRFITFTRGSNEAFRKGYCGSGGKEVWIWDSVTGEYSQLTDFCGNDISPSWSDSRTLYYLSEADRTYNLYRMKIDERGRKKGEPEQLTHFQGDGIRHFSLSADASTVAIERQTGIAVLDSAGRASSIEIKVSSDFRFDPLERKTFTKSASEFAVSPDEKYVAFVVRGEVFLLENHPDRKSTVQLTQHPCRDRDVAWWNESTLIFSSDREGQYDLYLLESSDPEEKDLFGTLRRRVVRLTTDAEDELEAVVSPDGTKVVFSRGLGKLVVAGIEDGRLVNETALVDGWASAGDPVWSPDSLWLAYSRSNLDFNSEIYIHAADNSYGPVNVTQHPRSDTSPFWSQDGSKLGFLSSRNNGDDDLWFAWLKKDDWEKTKQDWEQQEREESRKEPEKDGEDEKKAKKSDPIQIDFERIHDRLLQVTALPGNESDLLVSRDGKTFYFVANRSGRQTFNADQDLFSIKWDGTERKALTTGGESPSEVAVGPDDKHLFMLKEGGMLQRLEIESGKKQSLAFSARMEIDHVREKQQIFKEGWRLLATSFYDPNFHGQDWNALGEKYAKWAERTSTRRDFQDVVSMMLGELNASHLGFRGPVRAETQKEQTGLLGLEIVPVEDGVLLKRIVPRSPADRSSSKLEVEDVIKSVDGLPLAGGINFHGLLADKMDREILLSVRSSQGEDRTVRIRPAKSLRAELYDEWVSDRRRLTEQYSHGRLGYLHIQGMNWPSFERFERELVASGDGKEGIVIDVRFNGGGWTTDYLLAVLSARQHAYTIPRGAAVDLEKEHLNFRSHYPYGERLPLASWMGPAVTLCNQDSFSNAEIFSHAFKTLGLGKLVGAPTFGAVISTGDSTLIDGSQVRLPFRGWFVLATDENMEDSPAVPHIVVENPPDCRAKGEDPQLKIAVETLLAQIAGR